MMYTMLVLFINITHLDVKKIINIVNSRQWKKLEAFEIKTSYIYYCYYSHSSALCLVLYAVVWNVNSAYVIILVVVEENIKVMVEKIISKMKHDFKVLNWFVKWI